MHATRPLILSFVATSIVASIALLGEQDQSMPLPTAADRTDADAVTATGRAPGFERRAVDQPLDVVGPYGAPRGTRLWFRAEFASASRVHQGDGTRDAGHIEFDGDIEVTIVDRRDAEIVVLVTAAACDSLAGGTLVRMAADGATLGYRFLTPTTAEQRNWARTMVSAARCVVADGATWTATEADATGVAETSYRRGDGSIEKRKHGYAGAATGLQAHGEGTARLDAALGWLREVRYDEQLVITIESAGAVIESELRSRWTLARHDAVDPAALPDPGWTAAWLPADGSCEQATRDDAARLRHMREAVAGLTVGGLTARIAELLRQGGESSMDEIHAARRKLAWLIELDPSVLRDVADIVFAAEPDRDVAAVLLSAAGAAGTEPAQALLRDVADAAYLRSDLRMGAVHAMFDLRAPGADTVASVRALAVAADDAGLASAALLLSGALAHRAPELFQAQPVRELEAAATARGELHTWLDALGNEGNPDNLDVAARYLRHDDPQVRSSALAVARRVRGADAVAILVEASRDVAPSVRGEAARQLAARPEAEARARAIEILTGSDAPSVRAAVIDNLPTPAIAAPALRRVLEQLAAQDPVPAIRERAAGRLL